MNFKGWHFLESTIKDGFKNPKNFIILFKVPTLAKC